MSFRPVVIAISAALMVPFFVTGCGSGAATPSAGSNSSAASAKEIVVDGSSTVYLISLAAQEAYKKTKPDARVLVSSHGTGTGFSMYKEGEVDIVDASRPAKPKEEEAALKGEMPWTRFHVGYDGITVVINPKNDFVKSLTVAQLKQIFEPDSKIQTWKQLDPTWPDRKITLYTPDRDSGTFDFFTEEINGKAKAQRKDVQPSANDNFLVSGVAGDPDSLGYFGYAYYVANQDKVKAVAIQNGPDAKPVLPDPTTILDKTYAPLARRLYIYVKNSTLDRPDGAEFVQFYLDHVADLAKSAGYVAPTADDIAANTQALTGSKTKTVAK